MSLLWLRFWRSASLHQTELKRSFATPRLAALRLMAFISTLTPSLAYKFSMYRSSFSGFRAHPGPPLALGLKFKERAYIVCKQTTLTRARIVLRNFVFIHFENFEEPVTLLKGQPNRVEDLCSIFGSLFDCFVHVFTQKFAFNRARFTQTE